MLFLWREGSMDILLFFCCLFYWQKKEWREFPPLMQNECHIPMEVLSKLWGPQVVSVKSVLSVLCWPSSQIYLPPCLVPFEVRKLGVVQKGRWGARADEAEGRHGRTWELCRSKGMQCFHCLLLQGMRELTFPLARHIGGDSKCWTIVLSTDYAVTMWTIWWRYFLSNEHWIFKS